MDPGAPTSQGRLRSGWFNGPVRLQQVQIDGFCSWSSPFSWDLEPLDLVAIQGHNGAGKSSLLDAILWALYGICRVPGQADAVIPPGGRARVRVQMHHRGQTWAIVRTRERGRTGRTRGGVQLQREVAPGRWTLVSSGGLEEGQDLIGQVLGIPADTWLASVWAGQGDASRFCAAAPAQRRQLLVDMVASRWEPVHQQVGQVLEQTRRELGQLDAQIRQLQDLAQDPDDLRRQIETVGQQLAGDQQQLQQLRQQQAAAQDPGQHLALDTQVRQLRAQIQQHRQQTAQIDRLQQTVEGHTRRLQQLAESLGQAQANRRMEQDLQAQLQATERQLQQQLQQLQLAAERQVCPTCEQPTPTPLLQPLQELARSRLRQIQAQLQVQQDELEAADRQLAALQAELAQQTSRRDHSAGQLAALQHTLPQLAPDADRQLAALEGTPAPGPDLQTLVGQADQRVQQAQLQLGRLQQRLEDSVQRQAQLQQLQAQRDTLARQVQDLGLLHEAASRSGVPALHVGRLLPALQQRVQHWTRVMSRGQLGVQLVQQRRGRHSSLEVLVSTPSGTRAWAWASGGERRLVDLAVRIGLAQLHQALADIQINTLVVDEGWDTLDQQATHALVQALLALRGHFDLILTVTHVPEVAEVFPWQLQVSRGPQGSQAQLIRQLAA